MHGQIMTQRSQPAISAYYAHRLLAGLGMGRVHRYLFVRQPVDGLPLPVKGFEVCAMTANDPILPVIEPDPAIRQWRLEQGAICIVAFHKGDPAAHLWYVRHQFDEDEVRARYRVGTASIWDLGLEVRPRYRSGRAFAALWAGAASFWRAEGISMSFSRISDYNQTSLQPHLRMGAAIIGSALFVSIGKRQFCASRLCQGGRWTGPGQSSPCFDFAAETP